MQKIILLFIALYMLCGYSYAQNMSKKQKKKFEKLQKELEQSQGLAKIQVLDEMAEFYLDIDPKKSIDYVEQAQKFAKKTKIDSKLQANLYNTLGAAYFYQKNYKKSANYYEEELNLIKKSGQKRKIVESTYNIATIYKLHGKENKAEEYYKESIKSSKEIKSEDLLMVNYKALYDLYLEKKKYKEALEYFKLYISLKDAKIAKDTKKDITILRRKYNIEKRIRETKEAEIVEKDTEIEQKDSTIVKVTKEKITLIEDTIQKATQIVTLKTEKELAEEIIQLQKSELDLKQQLVSKQTKIIFLAISVGIILLASSFWLLLLYKQIKRKNKILNEQKEEIQAQSEEIEERNLQIIDSINYASRIQSSILIPETEIQRHLPEMFVLFEPRDIVSGDFYWFSKIEHKYIIAAIDCTGHGVPGAFLSMIGNTLLNEIVNEKKITQPDKILTLLHLGVLNALQQNKPESEAEDGMDMSLCTIDARQKRFQFAGAKNHLYVIQGDALKILKANYHSIGGKPLRQGMDVKFTSYDFMYDDKTSIYMLSDGYLDQFGGLEDTKFNSQRFKQMLIENRNMTMKEQKQQFQRALSEWKGNRKQVDDILIVGVKLPEYN